MRQQVRITQEQAAGLLASYRAAPGNVTGAATAAGVDRRTARKAWEIGWPHAPDHLAIIRKPIKDTLAEEQEYMRAELAKAHERAQVLEAELEAKRRSEQRVLAMADVTENRKAEAQLVRLARGSTIQALATLANVSQGVAKVGAQVKAALEAMAVVDPATGQPRAMTMGEAANAMRILAGVTTCLRQANDAGARAMEMERLLLGEPTSIVGHQHSFGPISLDEAAARIERARVMIDRARERGVVLDGGSLESSTPSNVVQLPVKKLGA